MEGGACVWCLCSDQDWRAAALWYAAYCGVSLSCWPLQMNGGMFVRFGSERAVMCPCAGIKTRSMSCESRARFAPSLPAAFARPCLHPSEYSAACIIENGRRRRRQVGLALGGSSRQARRNTMAQSDWPFVIRWCTLPPYSLHPAASTTTSLASWSSPASRLSGPPPQPPRPPITARCVPPCMQTHAASNQQMHSEVCMCAAWLGCVLHQ